jgi:outer membrane protein assembly factor BamB
VHSTPAVFGESVLISGCDGFFRMISIADGSEQKMVDLRGYLGASPAIRDSRVYVGTFENEVLCVDLEKFSVVWRYEHPRRHFPFYSSAAVTEKLVLVGGRDKMLHAIDRTNGQSVWTFSTRARIDSSPVVVGERVIFASKSGVIRILEVSTGKMVWEFDTGAGVVASPSLAEGKVVISTEEGLVYCFSGSE